MSFKVLATDPLVEGGLDLLARHYRLEVAAGLRRSAELIPALAGVHALVPLLTVPVTEEILNAAPSLRVVSNVAVGFENIDVEAATRRGIYVTNTPGVLTEATADLTWAALLAVTRRVVEGDALVREGGFTGWSPTLLLGAELQGKTLGIIGMGQIGQAVARRAVGFKMEVLFHDRSRTTDLDLGAAVARSAALEPLLRRSDMVSIHTPLTPQTLHLLDAERLSWMKEEAYLINTARGPIIHERALVEHLRAGGLGGAALDVFEEEPALTPGLAALPNVVLLPHLGSATRETRLLMARTAALNVHAVLSGEAPPNAVNRPRG